MSKVMTMNKSGYFESKRKKLEVKMIHKIREKTKYAPLQKRLFSFIIDYLVSSIFISMIPLLITSIVTQEKSFTIQNFVKMPLYMQGICGLIAILLSIWYFCIYPMREQNIGQTIGKKLMKIKVADSQGNDITYKNIVRRELIGSLLIEGETSFPSAFFKYFVFMLFPQNIAYVLSAISILLSLLSVLAGIFSKKHRMIHDLIGDTIVINK